MVKKKTKEPPPDAPPGKPVDWMEKPLVTYVNCPPGLEYLLMIDQLIVTQQIVLLEAFTGYETNNRYEIRNTVGQRVYFAAEDTCCATRNCCGSKRPFDIRILGNNQNEVIHLSAPFRCESCWFPCCLKKVSVEAPPGNVVGVVYQKWSVCDPKFVVQDSRGHTVFTIEGPCFDCAICGDIEFSISAKGIPIGAITKQWSGLLKEVFTDADTFGITFPIDLDVNMKATLLGALFLIDFMFFERGFDTEIEEPRIGMVKNV